MPQQPEAVALHDVLLRLLDHGALELDDPAAARADQVIVVLVLDLEAREAVVEVALAASPASQSSFIVRYTVV